MIHLDKDSAELFAQVLPVLTLVLLLEGRLPVKKYRSGIAAFFVESFRFLGVLYGSLGTLVCLLVVATGKEATPLNDLIFTAGFVVVWIAFTMLAFQLYWSPIKKSGIRAWQEHKALRKPRAGKR